MAVVVNFVIYSTLPTDYQHNKAKKEGLLNTILISERTSNMGIVVHRCYLGCPEVIKATQRYVILFPSIGTHLTSVVPRSQAALILFTRLGTSVRTYITPTRITYLRLCPIKLKRRGCL